MKNAIEQPCPLCGQQAKYEIFHKPYCKHFTCMTCVEYCIDAVAEQYLKSVPEEFRAKLSSQARVIGSDHMFVLREPNEVEMRAQPKPTLSMIAETVIHKK